MRRLPAGTVRKANTPEERMRVLVGFSNELCTMISGCRTPEQRQKALRKVTARFGENIALSEQDLRETMEKSFQRSCTVCRDHRHQSETIGIRAADAALGWRNPVQARRKRKSGADEMHRNDRAIGRAGIAPGSPPVIWRGRWTVRGGPTISEVILMAGIQDISNTLVEDFQAQRRAAHHSGNDVPRQGLQARHPCACAMRAANTMLGRFGFGPDAPEIAAASTFRWPSPRTSFMPPCRKASIS
jgi:hypothetical protein